MQNPIASLARPEAVTATRGPNPVAVEQTELARSVGYIALSLPALLWLGGWIAPLCRQSSISHYYYMPVLGSVMVACLGFIALFMWHYPGHTASDRVMARLGAVAAVLVAFFPTAGDGCAEDGFFARPIAAISGGDATQSDDLRFSFELLGLDAQTLHWGAAAVLFAILAWFCLYSFRRDNGEGVRHAGDAVEKSAAKTRRNRIYLLCGVVMLICMAALVADYGTASGSPALFPPVFLLEAIALAAFGVSWLVKGRVIRRLQEG